MIPIEPQTGFEICIGLMVVAFMAIALYDAWRGRVREWDVSEEQLCRCTDCSYTFVVRRKETVARCPRCSTLCSVRKRR